MKARWLIAAWLLVAGRARADEGLWTYDNFPVDKVQARYGFKPDAKWLEHLRSSAVRLSSGCSGSFVSEDGLILTNHHCARTCLQDVSTAEHDYIKNGFHAKTAGQEQPCPGLEVDQLTSIKDVTADLAAATRGLSGQKYHDAQVAAMGRLEKACATGPDTHCEVVTLYSGGLFHLYAYRDFKDVRVVFAPEAAIAHFGGDPDNFEFPRYVYDVAFLRAYAGGKPARVAQHLAWAKRGVRDGELTFVAGNPGRTDRLLTVAQLELERDEVHPRQLLRGAELRGLLTEFQGRGAEARRVSASALYTVENSFKGRRGRWRALMDPVFFAARVEAEKTFRARLAADPERNKTYGGAWDEIARSQKERRRILKPYYSLEYDPPYLSDLFLHARNLVRGAAERTRPDDQRLREFQDARLPAIVHSLSGAAFISPDLEKVLLTFYLTKLREDLGPDHAVVKKVLGKSSPEEIAARVVRGTKLGDAAQRKALWEGGKKAIDGSKDPMLELARALDPEARAVRREYEDKVQAVVKKNGELIGRARFELEGMKTYPDATFTPRVSYGQVRGWSESGRDVKPFTMLGGAFDRATGRPPFDLPPTWLAAQKRLTATTPFDLVTTHDIIGGNSGSPVVNRAGELVGLVFDSTILSLGGAYGYDERVQRAIAVDGRAIVHVLERVYGAKALVLELIAGRQRREP